MKLVKKYFISYHLLAQSRYINLLAENSFWMWEEIVVFRTIQLQISNQIIDGADWFSKTMDKQKWIRVKAVVYLIHFMLIDEGPFKAWGAQWGGHQDAWANQTISATSLHAVAWLPPSVPATSIH